VSLFALDVFGESHGFWRTLVALLIASHSKRRDAGGSGVGMAMGVGRYGNVHRVPCVILGNSI
jgi:hypothetical protein